MSSHVAQSRPDDFVESDVAALQFYIRIDRELGENWRKIRKLRSRPIVPNTEKKRREYDAETERLTRFIRGQRIAREREAA